MRDVDRMAGESGAGESGRGLGSFATGLCCGAVLGAVLALMYAPKPGAEMRRDLADQSERFRRRATDQAERLRQRATQIYADASHTFNQMVERGRGAIETGREAYRKARPHNGPAHDMPPLS